MQTAGRPGRGGWGLPAVLKCLPSTVPISLLKRFMDPLDLYAIKNILPRSLDLKMKGEDNSLLLTQGKLFLGNIFQGVGNVLPQGSFSQVNAENSIRS